jgi:hypothetical protein
MRSTISWLPLRFTDETYKEVVDTLPKILNTKLKVKPWGFVIGDSEDEYTAFSREGFQHSLVKTNRTPYTKELLKVLILLVEYDVTDELAHDDRDTTNYLEALEEVHAKFPLVSYNDQKRHFLRFHG